MRSQLLKKALWEITGMKINETRNSKGTVDKLKKDQGYHPSGISSRKTDRE